MDRRSQMAVTNLPVPRDAACSLPAPSRLRTQYPPLLCKWGNRGSKGMGPDPRSHVLFGFVPWKGKGHFRPLPSQPKKGIGLAGPSGLLRCLPPPSCPAPPSHPPNFHVLEKGKGWSLKSAGGNLLGEGRRWERLPDMLWVCQWDSRLGLRAPKGVSQQVTSERGWSGWNKNQAGEVRCG